jgi:hypothetical protein
MTYDINADSYPDYDEWGSDDYWLLPDWQKFYDELIKKYGADEGSRRWLDAWWRQGFGAYPVNHENDIKDWAIARGLWKGSFPFSSSMKKPSEFVPPSNTTQGQVTTSIDPKTGLPISNTSGQQLSDEELKKKKEEQNKKTLKGLLIGGAVLIGGLSIVYFVLKAKNKAQ